MECRGKGLGYGEWEGELHGWKRMMVWRADTKRNIEEKEWAEELWESESQEGEVMKRRRFGRGKNEQEKGRVTEEYEVKGWDEEE